MHNPKLHYMHLISSLQIQTNGIKILTKLAWERNIQEATSPENISFGMPFSEAGGSMEHLTTEFSGFPLIAKEMNT